MILAGAKAGHPFHGLWRSADGKILSPSAVEVDLPGMSPSGILFSNVLEFPPGDAYRIQVPDQPAVTNSAADDAAGLHWTNYGVMSGVRHRFAGHELGAYRWLYVAPDKSVWSADVVYDIPTGAVGVGLRRFGDFQPGRTQAYQLVQTSHGAGMAANHWMIDDINSRGSQVLITLFDQQYNGAWLGQDALYTGLRYCKGGIKLTLNGTPPAATLTAEVVVWTADCEGVRDYSASYQGTYFAERRDSFGNIIQVYTQDIAWVWPNSPPDYTGPTDTTQGWSGGFSLIQHTVNSTERRRDALVGLAFDASDAPHVVKVTIEQIGQKAEVVTPTTSGQAWHYGLTGTSSATGFYKIACGPQTLQVDAASNASYALAGVSFSTHETGTPGTASVTKSFGSYTETLSQTPIRTPGIYELFAVIGAYDAQFRKETDQGRVVALPVRYGNGLYGPALIQTGATINDVGSVKYRGIVSPTGQSAAEVSGTALAQHYATRDPKHGTISRSSTPICYV